ncbi:MAG: glycosyltransferase family 4 protein [Lachnospiraceae bacterium]|nr:glycosyltransferase family 4 protein [Lachnospiraceae bacterium]
MKICFVLPRMSNQAVGGYKIVYEYANRLTVIGHEVSLLYLNTNYYNSYHIPRVVKKAYFGFLNRREPKWFKLESRVEKISDYSTKRVQRLLAEANVAVATAVRTAPYVAERFATQNKIYLIQGRETWNRSEEYVDNTYRLGMKNVVISRWLKDIVDKASGGEAVLVRNPIDLTKYKVIEQIDNRRKHSLSVLYNPNPVKGFDNAFCVITKLKDKYPDLEVRAFGAYPKPEFFPSWIDYTENATQQQTIDIYNRTQVYLCSSVAEGYGLTGLEAMACGCALASTSYDAVYEYAVDQRNCLLSEVGDVDAQFLNVSTLFEDDTLRKKISMNALDDVKAFSWDVAIDLFVKMMER